MAMATDHALNGGENGAGAASNHDVRGLMEKVLDQLADTDRRSSNLLRQMQTRLDALGEQARAGRPGVPSEYRPGFERIEDGMSLLAHRISESFAAHAPIGATRHEAAAAPVFVPAPVAAPFSASALEPAPGTVFAPVEAYVPTLAPALAAIGVSSGTAPIAPPVSYETSSPQPLRSSSPGFVPARAGKLDPNIDPFDVIESLPGNPSEAWSSEQAEALAHIYDNREAMFGPRADQAESEPAADFASKPGVMHASQTRSAAPATLDSLDRTWLEGRFAEIAGRIEQSQAQTVGRAGDALAGLAHRFDALEHQLSEALHGLAGAQDTGSLHHFEDQIAGLTERLDQMHADLARFEAIETKLGSVLRKVSRERLTAIVGEVVQAHSQTMPEGLPGGSGRSEIEFHSVAIAAAEAAAARVAEQSPRAAKRDAAADARLDDVHALLNNLISERRHGEEQTASVLDNLQHAMVSLLDRMDGIEQSGNGPAGAEPHHRTGHVYPDDTVPRRPAAAAATAAAYDEREANYHHDEAPAVEPEFGPASRYDTEDNVIDPAEIADPIARQRASLRASAVRAATAQRAGFETPVAAGARAVPAGRTVRVSAEKPARMPLSRMLMMGGLAVVISIATGAGIVLMTPRGNDRPVATVFPPPPAGATARPAQAQAKVQPLGEAQNQDLLPPLDDPAKPDDGMQGERLPDDGTGRPAATRSSYSKPSNLRGIMIQGQTLEADPVPAARAARPAVGVAPAQQATAVKISATPADTADAAAMAADMDEQPKTALGLPPVTVGPLSLRLAAGNGDPSAEFEVASRLMEGKGTDQNLALAVRWYQRAATKGFAQAQYRLGTLFERGLGVTKDLGRAKNWYTRAAEQGNVKAMHNLAVLAAGRSGLAPDYDQAVKWFKAAARRGLADSQFNLAVLTESGLGVPKDQVQAAQWYIIAAQSGDREAIRRRDAIRAQLSKGDLANVDAYVREWKADVPDKLANDASFAGQAWKARQPGSNAENG